MSIIEQIWSRFSRRSRFLVLYRSGITKARERDFAGAIRDYTGAIESPDVPPDVKAMAIYNRALAYDASQQHELAAADLKRLLRLPDLPEEIKSEALRRQDRIRRKEAMVGRSLGAPVGFSAPLNGSPLERTG